MEKKRSLNANFAVTKRTKKFMLKCILLEYTINGNDKTIWLVFKKPASPNFPIAQCRALYRVTFYLILKMFPTSSYPGMAKVATAIDWSQHAEPVISFAYLPSCVILRSYKFITRSRRIVACVVAVQSVVTFIRKYRKSILNDSKWTYGIFYYIKTSFFNWTIFFYVTQLAISNHPLSDQW